jgi:asparagine synthase (glutamine-hydrolysing)
MSTRALADDRTAAGWLAVWSGAAVASHASPLAFAGLTGRSGPETAHSAAGAVLFDGVLYEREALAGRLGVDPRRFGDAALILQALERSGADVARQIKGLFALVAWDAARGQLIAIRDALGAYPLFYAHGAGGTLLASTSIEALVRHPAVDPAINRAALADHLCHRWPYPDETFYRAVKRVLPGCRLIVDRAGARVERYWDPAPPGEPVNWIGEEELASFGDRLDTAVGRMLAQGRAGIFLSGGLDSISVAAFAADRARRSSLPPPIALSLGFPHPECNEETVQRGVAGALGLEQEFVPFGAAVGGGGLLAPALEYSRSSPAPMLNTWSPAYTELARRGKRRGVQVIMTGAGGDEWLTVSPYLAADLMRAGDMRGLAHLVASWRRSYRMPLPRVLRTLLWTFGGRPLAGLALHRLAPAMWHRNRLARLQRTTRTWVAPEPALRRELDARTADALRPAAPRGGFYFHEVRAGLDHPLTSMELEEIFEMGRRLDLRFRHPYWDADVVDLLYRTPPHLLSLDGRAKSLVRETVATRFPTLGLSRQKKIAGTSFFRSVLRNEVPALWKRTGGVPTLARLGIVEARAAHAVVEASLAESSREGLSRIWDMLNLDAWVQAHERGR